MIKVDQSLLIKSLGIKGKVVYIDQEYLFHDYMYPVQLELVDKYCDEDQPNAYMYRCGLKDLEIKI